MGLTGGRPALDHATQDPKYSAGMLQSNTCQAPLVFYSRLQIIRNQRQAVAGRPDDYATRTSSSSRVRHAARADLPFRGLLELTYWRQTIKQVAPGTNATHQNVDGIHLLF